MRESEKSKNLEALKRALAFDLAHEFVFKARHLHIRKKTGGLLCGREIDGLEPTPYGGAGLCKGCAAEAGAVRWREPEHVGELVSVCELAERMGVGVRLVDNLPDGSGGPAGAVLTRLSPPILYIARGKGGALNRAQVQGALHELAHVATSPDGFNCEISAGHYAVQYALTLTIKDAGPLLRRTKRVMHNCDIFAGMMQARAWALGYLDDRRLAGGIEL